MERPESSIRYKRERFSTRLPADCRYTRAHYWLRQCEGGLWRIGLTKFATRMLGDLVEYEFSVSSGGPVALGQSIGWVEGFKAVSDVYSAATGIFRGSNAELRRDITLLESDPYGAGWLYEVAGNPDPENVNVHGYVSILDATIDHMLASRRDQDPNA
jgi:glycine cleavage system H protein